MGGWRSFLLEPVLARALEERQSCNRWWGRGALGGRDRETRAQRPVRLEFGEVAVCEKGLGRHSVRAGPGARAGVQEREAWGGCGLVTLMVGIRPPALCGWWAGAGQGLEGEGPSGLGV